MDRQCRDAKPLGLALLLTAACAVLAVAPIRSVVAEEASPPEPTVVRADNGSLTLTWRTTAFSVRQARDEDGALHSVVEAPGWPTSGVPGEPALPYSSVVAVVPPTGEIAMDVESSGLRTASLSFPLKTEPMSQVPEAYRQPGMVRISPEPQARAAGRTVSLEELGWLRGHRLVRLTFFPVRYDDEQGTLEIAEEAQVRLTFTQPPEESPEPEFATAEAAGSDPFAGLLQNVVVNPDQVRDFAREEEVTPSGVTALSAAANGAPRYKVAVTEEGLYELTYETLRDAGLPLDQAPEGLRLRHAGEDVAYQWEGDTDGTFEAGERILFYARPSPSRWAAHDVYWLSAEGASTPMATRSSDPAGVDTEGTLWATTDEEQNEGERNYLNAFQSERDGDHWYWDRLWREYAVGGGEYDKYFDVALLDPDPAGSDGALRLYLQGTSSYEALDPDHRVAVSLNAHGLGQIAWDGTTYYSATLSVPMSALEPDLNEVRLTLPGNGATSGVEAMWLDAIEVRYPVSGVRGQPARLEGESGRNRYTVSGLGDGAVRIYDVSEPLAPQIVTGATVASGSATFADADASTATYYLLTEDQTRTPEWIEPAQTLPEPSSTPDYLIVSHSDFIPALAPLVDHRATQDGLVVHTVPVEAVYDIFGDGRVDPQAIKNYVAYAFEQWAPEYLLLVGDGTHDPLNNYGSPDHRPTFVPPYLGMVDPYWGEAPSDNRFATLDGPDDQLPELFVGRLPVNTPVEVETVVAKILAYDEAPPPGPWNEPLLFFAGAPDGATDFHAYSDAIYDNVLDLALESHTPERIYYCEEDCTESYQISNEDRMRSAVLRRLNQGALMATWTGHSSWHQWGANRLFHLDDLANLRNGGALPVFLQMTCFTSYFSQPTGDTLDESLLRLADGGAIATWGPTSLGLTAGHVSMHKAFTDATLGEPSVRLGPATVTARLALDEAHASLWDTYALFGDPAMGLNLDVDVWRTVHLPLVIRSAAVNN
jgi:hypothetical protein